ncbi:preprotein translocase subunit SecA [Wenyingzhuangia sp. 2_MG-2023]|uniref:preprotein translocase subunit SecA n=1 Tax=Wenyingzhuangia sp. 2_MG-2023 TaxID=3062639 RepID=UPI0026E366E7|nr:preprotein translocase subunit SecA [Wenyingzhuangia sp. 2_MG-2023]MDO6738637.1 preprotein translocase subunit SecA [Wenyingzhuangia sp. 2_MG-2023]
MGILDSVIKIFVGDKQQKDLKTLQPIVGQVRAFEDALKKISIDELRAKTVAFKNQIKEATQSFENEILSLEEKAKTAAIDDKEAIYNEIDVLKDQAYEASEKVLNNIQAEAFAVIKETARRFTENKEIEVLATAYDRELAGEKEYVDLVGEDKAVWYNSWDASGTEVTWNMIHYDVQLIGGAVLHQGKIAEMMTGEGKTLVATLPLYLNALAGKGVHVVTVNDYLAKRDSAWMAPVFQFHGLTIDCIDLHPSNSAARRKAYNADITYGTNNEFGFDYLRDNMASTMEDLVQRKPNYAIVDEVDSVLIDDARTPLIISGQVQDGDRHEFNELKPKVADIVQLQSQYLVQVLANAKKLIKEGDTKEGGFQLLRVHRGLPKNKALIKFLSQEGIRQLLQKTENHYMADNNKEMPQVDNELYFVIEEKSNSIELTEKGIAALSGEEGGDFFVLPDIGVKIGAIEKSEISDEEKVAQKEELYRDFSIKSERIHTLNQLLKAYTLFEKDVEYVVMENKVKIVDEQTGRIMDGRRYSDGLHQAIEAKENVKIEAASQTYATVTLQNYFRMYRKLSGMTGTAITEAGEFWQIYELDVVEIPTNRPIAREDKEDMIYKTQREKYNAVIDDIVKLVEAGRPVLVGTTSVEISELLGRMLSIRKIKHNVLNAKLHKKEADIVAEAGKPGIVTIATNMAGRGTDIKLSDQVKASGGLAIIGTERHDSRRVDRQLRGRAGRQGDVGSSQFYVSLEDNLMRLFGSDRIAKMMDRMGLEEGEVIQHSMITKSIERAQKKVEENNFGIRKRLLEYDDIMNAQREVVYKRRRHALDGKRLQVDIANMIYDACAAIVDDNKATNDYKNFEFELIVNTSMSSPFTEEEFNTAQPQELSDKLYEVVMKHYQNKMARNANTAFPIIKNVFENEGDKYERIVVPFSDGVKTLRVVTDLRKSYETEGAELIYDFEKNITLAIIDDEWKDHLRKMDDLKQSVQNASYEQKDPLLIYKFEAFELFKKMLEKVNKEVLSFLFKGELPESNQEISEAKTTQHKPQNIQASKQEVLNSSEDANRRAIENSQPQQQPIQETIVREQPKIGRNDKVTIQNVQTGEKKETKFKQAIPLLESGQWVLTGLA